MLNWQAIDTVLLDMDGTLLDLAYDNHFWLEHIPRAFAQKHALALDQAKEKLYEKMSATSGTLEWYCIDHWSKTLGFDVHEHVRNTAHQSSLRPHVFEFLNFLQSRQKEVLLVTNAHQVVLESKLTNIKIEPYFDRMVTSHQFHAPKESQEFWQRFAQAYPFNAQRTLLIDDNEAVLNAANQFGIKYLVTLKQPDSRREIKTNTQHPAIHHFEELLSPQYG